MLRPWQGQQARLVIERGGVIAYPTEAVYGLGAHPEIADAVMHLLQIKHRNINKGLILVASSLSQITHYIYPSASIDWTSVSKTWPGPVTWVFPASREVPVWLRGKHQTIAIRISAHPLVRTLCEWTGPIVSTSANPESLRPAKSAHRVRAYFGDELDMVIPGAVGELVKPTEIRDSISGKILRAG